MDLRHFEAMRPQSWTALGCRAPVKPDLAAIIANVWFVPQSRHWHHFLRELAQLKPSHACLEPNLTDAAVATKVPARINPDVLATESARSIV